MIIIPVKRVLDTVAITSLVALFTPARITQPSVLAIALPPQPEEISVELKQPTVRDGVYLFNSSLQSAHNLDLADYGNGSESQASEYIVLQLENNQVIGGFYQPLSEYSCFAGNFHGETLDLWVSMPDTSDVYTYSISIQLQTPVASHPGAVGLPTNELVIQGAHRIVTLDQVSQNVLNECLTRLSV